jgi:hypothetical protein
MPLSLEMQLLRGSITLHFETGCGLRRIELEAHVHATYTMETFGRLLGAGKATAYREGKMPLQNNRSQLPYRFLWEMRMGLLSSTNPPRTFLS